MKRYKRIYILLGVLCVACVVTFAVTRYEARREQIESGEAVVWELDTDTVESLSWEYEGQTLSFHTEDTWSYDEDAAFPVDDEKIASLLEQFQAFSVSFTITDPEDLSQYGLDDPVCTITIGTADETYTVLLGDFSTMDSQRYVSIGDGNVYLAQSDPLDAFDAELSDLIQNNEISSLDQVSEIVFSGTENYTITYEEDSTDTYREEDVYFTQQNGAHVPLDTDRVEDYLYTLEYLDLTDYVTYDASEEDLAAYGLDAPELTVTVDYTAEDADGNETSETLVLHVSRDLAELASQEGDASEEADSSDETEETAEDITAYARVDDSPIVYQITGDEYLALLAASYNDLRHAEVLPAAFANVSQIDITLEGTDYTIASEGSAEDRTYTYQDEELEITDLQSALESLTADSFTDEEPTQRQEISLTLHLDLEGQPTVQIDLYRYDGSYCLAVVDGEPVSLVARSAVVTLIEAVNAIVLN